MKAIFAPILFITASLYLLSCLAAYLLPYLILLLRHLFNLGFALSQRCKRWYIFNQGRRASYSNHRRKFNSIFNK